MRLEIQLHQVLLSKMELNVLGLILQKYYSNN